MHSSVDKIQRVEAVAGIGAAPAAASELHLVLAEPPQVSPGERARRLLNVGIALVLLLLSAPLILIVALLVRLSSRGPVIYRQTRVGVDRRQGKPGGNWRRKTDLGGRPFTVYKFRTMTWEGPGGDEVWATPDDPRITWVGHFLRRTRLDELPQLFNVLKGDMNVVGPRPEQPQIFAKLRDHIDQYPHRQKVLPGITGLAQINHHYDRSIEDVKTKVRFDLEYLERASVLHDLSILAKTVPVVVFRKGAW